MKMISRLRSFLVISLFSCLLSLTAGCAPEIVDTGHRGVLTTFGEVDQEVLGEGLHWYFWAAGQNIHELNVRTSKTAVETQSYTRDVQVADLKLTVNYNLDPTYVTEMYQEVGEDWDEVLVPQKILDSLKGILGHWTAEELIAKRDEAKLAIFAEVAKNLASAHVIVTSVDITDISYSDGFENAVEKKVTQIELTKAEVNKTQQVMEQATQKIRAAEGEAQAMRLQAKALEENPKLVEWKRVDMQRDVGLAMAASKSWPSSVTIIGGDSLPSVLLGGNISK